MPQRDTYHASVVKALIQDNWEITDDPLHLSYGGRNVYVDIGAEQPIGAEKEGQKIAVEIKSFVGESDVHDLSLSVGQYNLYRNILAELEPERVLFLAVSAYVYDTILQEPLGQLMIIKEEIKIIVFDDQKERIQKWLT